MKIRAVRADLFHADGRTDIKKLRLSRFSQFYEKLLKMTSIINSLKPSGFFIYHQV